MVSSFNQRLAKAKGQKNPKPMPGANFHGQAAAAPAYTFPAFSVAPSITGNPYVDVDQVASPGTITGTPTPSVTYQWNSGNQPIQNSNGATQRALNSHKGGKLRVTVTARNILGSASATAETALITDAP